MTPPVFVVGTGRCGSTMVSGMLKKHPAVLSISEFFSSVTDLTTQVPQAFPPGIIDASQFWSILSAPHPKENLMMRYGLVVPGLLSNEIITSPRFEAGIPNILGILGYLTDDFVAVFDELHRFITSQPPASIQHHYLCLFTWLQQRFERHKWVERSGGSLHLFSYLSRTFPDARFIHLVRDGRDVAISMSKNLSFRMVQLTSQFIEKLGVDPFESQDRSRIEELSRELRFLLPESFNASVFLNYHLPLSQYGRYWSAEIVQGLRFLKEIPPQRILTLRYEDIMQSPEASVRAMIAFIDPVLVDEDWIRTAIARVRSPRSSWKTLPPDQQEQLTAACSPGFAALKAVHLSWE